MARRGGVNPKWLEEMKAIIESDEFQTIVLSYNIATQWLIAYLANKNIPVVVTNLGAGVKRITIADKVCTKCKGTGKEK